MEADECFSWPFQRLPYLAAAALFGVFGNVSEPASAQTNQAVEQEAPPSPAEMHLYEALRVNLGEAEMAVAPFSTQLPARELPVPSDIQIIQRGWNPGTIQAVGLQNEKIWIFEVDASGALVRHLGTQLEADAQQRQAIEASVHGSQLIFTYAEQMPKNSSRTEGSILMIPTGAGWPAALPHADRAAGDCDQSCRVRSILKTKDAIYLTEKTNQRSVTVQRLGTIGKIDRTDP